jgi:hypothetical protein
MLCACSPEKLNSHTVEENLKDCVDCGIVKTCPYPNSIALLMKSTKTDTENQIQAQSSDGDPDLQKIASESMTFSDFHERVDRLHRESKRKLNQHFTKKAPRKTLTQIAQESLTFGEYTQRAHEEGY